MTTSVIHLLRSRPVLWDGAMGTILHNKISRISCYDYLNISHPDIVAAIHKDYIQAGAQIIQTNSFGANRLQLRNLGLEHHLEDTNIAAVKLAKTAATSNSLIAGTIGPVASTTTAHELFECFLEQANILAEEGVDLLVIETMWDVHQAETAVKAAASIKLPVICTVTFELDLRARDGALPAEAARRLLGAGSFGIGINCGYGPEHALAILKKTAPAAKGHSILVQPNAGVPTTKTLAYDSPDKLAEYALKYLAAGATMIGGCCGTSPAHIKAIKTVLTEYAREQL